MREQNEVRFDRAERNRRWRRTADSTVAVMQQLGEASFKLDRFYINENANAHALMPCNEMTLFDEWHIDRYVLYQPLVYLTAFGADEIFEMLYICLQSLNKRADEDFDILIVSRIEDRLALENILLRFDCAFRSKVFVRFIKAHTVFEFATARYRIEEILSNEEITSYAPVLYLDTDIICDASLKRLFRSNLQEDAIFAVAENQAFSPSDFWGRSMFLQDGVIQEGTALSGFSTGVLLAASMSKMISLFGLFLKVAEAWHRTNTKYFTVFDQPIAVFAFEKIKRVEKEYLSKWVYITGVASDPDPQSAGKGLAHFAGGVGNSLQKLPMMKRYAEKLGVISNTSPI